MRIGSWKKSGRFFRISVHVYSLLGQTERKEKVFFGKDRKGWCKVRLPQIALSCLWDLKSFTFCEIWITPPPSLLFSESHTTKCINFVDRFQDVGSSPLATKGKNYWFRGKMCGGMILSYLPCFTWFFLLYGSMKRLSQFFQSRHPGLYSSVLCV